MSKLIIVGASGHGKVVADIASLTGYTDIVFLDDNPNNNACNGYQVIGPTSMLADLDGDMFIAIGNANVRKRIMETENKRNYPILIHPNAVVAKGVRIGRGSVVMAGAVINPCTTIGEGSIINTCSSVDHDCTIGDYVHIAVGAHVCGTVSIGESTWIGAGATVCNNIDICGGCMIGAGAVVINNIDNACTAVGIPARPI